MVLAGTWRSPVTAAARTPAIFASPLTLAASPDENSAQVRASDATLVRLNGRDSVAHPPGAAGAQRGERGGLAGRAGLVAGVRAEHVMAGAAPPPAGGVQVAAAGHAVPL